MSLALVKQAINPRCLDPWSAQAFVCTLLFAWRRCHWSGSLLKRGCSHHYVSTRCCVVHHNAQVLESPPLLVQWFALRHQMQRRYYFQRQAGASLDPETFFHHIVQRHQAAAVSLRVQQTRLIAAVCRPHAQSSSSRENAPMNRAISTDERTTALTHRRL